MISVITCTWNSMATLRQTVDSVLAQQGSPYVHIFVDGGSTDRRMDIVATLQKIPADRLKLKICRPGCRKSRP